MAANYPEQSKKSYLTMSNYYNDIFSYTTQTDARGKTTGSLSLLEASISANCSKGRFLVENGKKLYPGGSYPGISTLLVGVHDAATGVKGFIDPNSYAFTNFSSDRPAASVDYNPMRVGVNPNGSLIENDLAPPVYTHGDIIADGSAIIRGYISTPSTIFCGFLNSSSNITAGGYISTPSTIFCGFLTAASTITAGRKVVSASTIESGSEIVATSGQVRVNKVVSLSGAGPFVIDPTLAQVFYITADNTANTPNITSINESLATGAVVYIIVFNSYTSGSRSIDFNANFRTVGAGQRTIGASTRNTFTFVCDGTNLFQVAEALDLTQ
jgi:hypothetical protein